MHEPLQIEIEFWNLVPDAYLHTTLHMYDEQQVVAFSTFSTETDLEWTQRPFPIGLFRTVCHIPGNFLNSGLHRVVLLVVQDQSKIIFAHEEALLFNVLDLAQRSKGWMAGNREQCGQNCNGKQSMSRKL